MNRLHLLLSFLPIVPLFPATAVEQPGAWLLLPVVERQKAAGLDLKSPVAVFSTVFSKLPAVVTVDPTENYFYWQLDCDGRDIRGNIRLPSGQREKGSLCLGYAEFDEVPAAEGPKRRTSTAKYFNKEDGVEVTCPDAFTSVVKYQGKSVLFHFHQILQLPPKQFALPPDEAFVERTCDESGFQFFLLYNTVGKYFLWVLNEEAPVPDQFHSLADGVLLGHRSGFVFWTDKARGGRKILAAVREESVVRNDYFDGPFDQLADNYADQAGIRNYMEEAFPACKDRIDKWGYYTGSSNPKRVALNNYGTWHSVPEILAFLEKARASGDERRFISQAGK